jgi:adenylate kinase
MRRHFLLIPLLLAPALWAQAKPPLILILLGAPGSGKSTQSEKITAEFGVPGVSTGALLRAEVQAKTPLGQSLEATMKKGGLVSDDVVNELVAARIAKAGTTGGLILDGYPRNVAQAQFLDQLMAKQKLPAPVVLNFAVTAEEVTKRLAGRGRADDQPKAIAERMAVYDRETKPLLDFYSSRGLKTVETSGTPDEVYARVRAALGKK